MEVAKAKIAQEKYKQDKIDKNKVFDARHAKFQFGTNPMKKTSFEEELAQKEAVERQKARIKYVLGVQGRDGGCSGSEVDKQYDDLY